MYAADTKMSLNGIDTRLYTYLADSDVTIHMIAVNSIIYIAFWWY